MKYISPFDLDVMQIEQCVNITHVTWKSKTRPEHFVNMYNHVNKNLLITVKETSLCLSRKRKKELKNKNE